VGNQTENKTAAFKVMLGDSDKSGAPHVVNTLCVVSTHSIVKN